MKSRVLTLIALCCAFSQAFSANAKPLKLQITIPDMDRVQLKWSASEPAVAFIVESATATTATGELQFHQIERIAATGKENYTFTHKSNQDAGLRYYRLVQVNPSGAHVTSNIQTVNFQYQEDFISSVAAGKRLNLIDIDISVKTAGTVTIMLEGVISSMESSWTLKVNRGSNHFVLPVSPTAELGTYLLTIAFAESTQVVMLRKEETAEIMVSEQ